MLPDRSILIIQKLAENAKFDRFKCDIMGNFVGKNGKIEWVNVLLNLLQKDKTFEQTILPKIKAFAFLKSKQFFH